MINLVPSSPSWLSKLLPLYDFLFGFYVFVFALASGGTILMSYLAKELRRVADQKISVANDAATQAGAQAASANAEAARAKEQAGLANERAGKANERAEELAAKNLATEAKLEEERRTRLELEKSLAPRTLALRVEGETSNIDSLRPFGGINVILEVLPDAEAERAAGYISWILTQAKWKIVSGSRNPDLNQGEYDGVVIQHRIYPGVMTPESVADRSRAAATALLEFLRSNNWEAETVSLFPRHHDKMPANTIRIMVGFKPSPYFLPPEIKKARERMERDLKRLFLERNKPRPPDQE